MASIQFDSSYKTVLGRAMSTQARCTIPGILGCPGTGDRSPAFLPRVWQHPAIPTAHLRPPGFRDGAGWGQRAAPRQECWAGALHLCGTLLHTCTPRPCIWMTWARRVWIPLRMVFWCSASVIPRLRMSLQNEPTSARTNQL